MRERRRGKRGEGRERGGGTADEGRIKKGRGERDREQEGGWE